MPVWLKANQSVCTSWEFVGVHCGEKREFVGTFLVVIIFLTCFSEKSQEQRESCHHLPDLFFREEPGTERIITVLWDLVQCPLYFVTYGLHRKNSSTTTTEGAPGKQRRAS